MNRKSIIKLLLVLVISTVLIGATVSYLQPVPPIRAQTYSKDFTQSEEINLPWPDYGQSALGAGGFGVLETHGEQKAAPIASVAKVITALAILEKKPLASGDKGPVITLGPADVQLFEGYYARGGSVVKVQNGEEISQYEALQAMLLPSGNNMADSLAIWAFGSLPAYLNYANKMLQQMGLTKTRVADASGFSADTVSSAQELVRIGERVLSNTALAQIVSQEKATIPVAGEISNVNWALGQDGVVGIKTGNTDEAGGCFLFAAERSVEGQTVKVIGAILDAPTRDMAIADSKVLIRAADSGFEERVLIENGEAVGQYLALWGASATAVAKSELSSLVWKGSLVTSQIKLESAFAGAENNREVGTVIITVGGKNISQKVILAKPLTGPSWQWRIFHL